jgi:GT2 family glycosyltransferase
VGLDLSIVIVNWRSVEFLRACLASVERETTTVNYEVIVVDNASGDGCSEMLAAEFPKVVFVQSEVNLGFSGANNLGVRYARGRVLLFLNPDTEILDGAIDVLYREVANLSAAGVAGCRLLNSDGTVQTSAIQSFPTILNQLLNAELLRRCFPNSALWGNAALFQTGPRPVIVDSVSGACMMVRRDVFDRVGGFSSDYFMYAEDSDLCFKTRAAGHPNYYVGSARIVHHGGGSSQRAASDFSHVMMRESIARFLCKFRGRAYGAAYRLTLSAAALLRLVVLALTFPVWLVQKGVSGWALACRKWLAIFRWGIGLAPWARKEHPRLGVA